VAIFKTFHRSVFVVQSAKLALKLFLKHAVLF